MIFYKAVSSSVTDVNQVSSKRVPCYTIKLYTIGKVDKGGATMDWVEQEKEHRIAITSACGTTGSTSSTPRGTYNSLFTLETGLCAGQVQGRVWWSDGRRTAEGIRVAPNQ